MSSAVIAENYSAAKLKEYICFVEQLGSNIHFHENRKKLYVHIVL